MITIEEWKSVEDALKSPLSNVKMMIDGYNVTIAHAMVKPLQFCLAIYIDGKFDFKWAMDDTDIRRRFCCKHTKSMLTAKDKKKLHVTDKQFQKLKKKHSFDWYDPYWNSFRSMKAHFVKNNKSIELISIE